MATKERMNDDAIRRLLNRGKLEMTSEDFTARLMERFRFQWLILAVAFGIAVLLLFFPVWSWFGIEFTPGLFILFYAAEIFRTLSVWLGEGLSHLAGMGKMMYLLPVSVALLLLVSLDQALKRPAHKTSRA
jgi:hypothetical protein